MNIDDPVTSIKGVGSSAEVKLQILGIKTVGDLIDHYPRKYDDYSEVQEIAKIKPGIVTIRVKIKQITPRYARRGLHITEAVASDATGSTRLIWFNQPYRANSIDLNMEYFVRGDFGLRHQRLSILNPTIELCSDFPVHSARIVPTYKLTKGLTSSQLRKIIASLLPAVRSLPETLPDWLVKQEGLISRAEALEKLHFPDENNDIELARKRIGFEEVFQLAMAALLNKADHANEQSLTITFDEASVRAFVRSLPFELTEAQRKATWQIYKDLGSSRPMNRLLEGDVGSGKTVVALMAALATMQAGFQTAMMAPTEILARQHAEALVKMLEPVQFGNRVTLLLGTMSTQQKLQARKAIASGVAGIVVGTSALIQEKVDMKSLALVIIDEQHRFGVEQRKKLQQKAGRMPHVLSMTATPIPRSLALTLYGELDVTIISEKPKDRLPIITKTVSPNSTKAMYEAISVQLDAGQQVFVVCPNIDESDIQATKSVVATYDELRLKQFAARKVGLLHGKLKAIEKETVMKQFSDGLIDVLVTTTVIEVGVDVPNATVIVIENPEKFGLAQIHQLRGRVGRGDKQGYCYLVMSDSSAPSRRLRALESKNDGFELAELDLEIRGPGAIYGTTQHGVIDLRIAKLSDVKLIAAARNAAQECIDRGENLLHYPVTHQRVQKLRSITNLN